MKLAAYREKLQHDPDYRAAEDELHPLLDLADAVLALRLAHGWSQAELAERAGTKQANISRLESGLANPSVKFLQKVANAFGETLIIQLHPIPAVAPPASPAHKDQVGPYHYARTGQSVLPAIHDSPVEWLAGQVSDTDHAAESQQDELKGRVRT